MTLKHLLSAAAIGAMTIGAPAMAQQNPADLTHMSIRILNDECPSGTCDALNSATADEAGSLLTSYVEDRSNAAAQSAANASSNQDVDNGSNGRGIAQGQQNNDPQVVYLAFGSADPTFNVFIGGQPFAGGVFNDYIYTQEDRDFIQARMEADYEGFNIVFTQTEPSLGDYSTIRIGDNDANPIDLAGGILFGRADNIDFKNDDRRDGAFADASFWQLLAELDANFGTQNLANFLGLPGPLDAAGIEEFRQIAVVNQSANTSSHELGHILGLRHHDSFGAPGDGLPAARNPGEFIPLGETDQNAAETLSHVMASGASAGLALNSPPFVDRFFSERSAVKLAINERTREIDESSIRNGKLDLKKVVGVNPLEDGVNADGQLDIRAAIVLGNISELDEVDSYEIKGVEGEIFNAEIISNSDRNFADPIIAKLTLSLKQKDGSLVEVAANQRTFEGLEPLIFDFTLPATGNYVLQVSSPDLVPLSNGQFVPLSAFGLTSLRTGDYDILAYVVEGKSGGGKKSGK